MVKVQGWGGVGGRGRKEQTIQREESEGGRTRSGWERRNRGWEGWKGDGAGENKGVMLSSRKS